MAILTKRCMDQKISFLLNKFDKNVHLEASVLAPSVTVLLSVNITDEFLRLNF